MKKKCKHIFKHKVITAKNMRGTEHEWIIHKCFKCGLTSDAIILIDKLYEEEKEKLKHE